MALMTRPRLKQINVIPDFKMELTFINNAVFTVDFKPFFIENIGLAPLKDPDEFAKAVIITGEGWTVEWLDRDIQIGSDTLWLDAQAQNATDENTRLFAVWRAKYGLGLKQASEALGLTPRTISAYSNGARPVPRTVALACKGWEAIKLAA